jgi:hypothetical protein
MGEGDGASTEPEAKSGFGAFVERAQSAFPTEPNAVSQKALAGSLGPGEEIALALRGSDNGYIAITNQRRVFVVNKSNFVKYSAFSKSTRFSKRVSSFDADHVTGIHVHTGTFSGWIVVNASGHRSVTTREQAEKADNAILISRPFGDAQRIVGEMQGLIAAAPQVQASPQTADIPEQLRKLAELRDAGVLTAQEFDDKKRELLARM